MTGLNSYNFTLSPYAETISLIRKDIRKFLATALDLPTPYKSADPLLGERYIGLLSNTLTDSPHSLDGLRCQILISGAFQDATGQKSLDWAESTGINLHHLLPQVKFNVDQRGIFYELEKTGSLYVGRPRNPARANGTVQPSDIWMVDVALPVEMKLLIPIDLISGHV